MGNTDTLSKSLDVPFAHSVAAAGSMSTSPITAPCLSSALPTVGVGPTSLPSVVTGVAAVAP